MNGGLAGQVALVTGAGRGIGRALALKLAHHGASVVVNDADEEPAGTTVELVLRDGGTAIVCPGSVSEPGFPAHFVGSALEYFGRIDIIVNNAGFSWDGPIRTISDERWTLVHDVNLAAPFRILREASAFFRNAAEADIAAGREVFRKVVNVSSMSATRGNAGQAVYASAKAGLIGLTRALSKEWGRYRVNVNCVAFGAIETRQTDERCDVEVAGVDVPMGVLQKELESLTDRIPLGRLGRPEEAANAIYLFCTSESDYISGQVIEVGGGLSA